jgi:hypothetical protein
MERLAGGLYLQKTRGDIFVLVFGKMVSGIHVKFIALSWKPMLVRVLLECSADI